MGRFPLAPPHRLLPPRPVNTPYPPAHTIDPSLPLRRCYAIDFRLQYRLMSKISRFVGTTTGVITIISIAALGLRNEYQRGIENLHPYPPHGEKSVLVFTGLGTGYTELAACDPAGPSPLTRVEISENITFYRDGLRAIRLPGGSGLKIAYSTPDPNELGQITIIPIRMWKGVYRVFHQCIFLENPGLSPEHQAY